MTAKPHRHHYFGKPGFYVEPMAELANFTAGRYPGFVTGSYTLTEPAVFSFHNVLPEKFLPQLEYLKVNGYKTLSADEYLELRVKGKSDPKSVLLTFDDGPESLWTVAYPLLKKFGMRAIAFVPAGEIREADKPRPFHPAVSTASGAITFDTNPSAGDQLCTWPELSAMKGTIDIQSHGYYHWLMFVSPRLTGFVTPDLLARWQRIDLPLLRDKSGEDSREYPLGTPIYETTSRLGEEYRMVESPAVRERCVEFVQKNGGAGFFNSAGWEQILRAEHDKSAAMEPAGSFTRESEKERIAEITKSVFKPRSLLESRLGVYVEHFCPPFTIAGPLALKTAADSGYKTVFWGVTVPEYAHSEKRVLHVRRIKDDYIHRLPGKGRKPLVTVLFEKGIRRLKNAITGKGKVR